MKSILIALLAVTVVSITGTSAMAEQNPAANELTDEQKVQQAYNALKTNRVDIPYNIFSIIYDEYNNIERKYRVIIDNTATSEVVLKGIQTYEGSDIITAPKVMKYDIIVITPKTHATVYVLPETRTTTISESQYTFTLEQPSTTVSIPTHATFELAARADGVKSKVSFDKAVQIDIRGIDPELKPFWYEPGTSVIKKIDKCNGSEIKKSQTVCYIEQDASTIVILTKHTGIFGLHPKVVDGEVVRKMPYRNNVFETASSNEIIGYIRDAISPKCSEQTSYPVSSSIAENNDIIINVQLTDEQKADIVRLSMVIVDINTGKLIAVIPYSISEDGTYTITRQDLNLNVLEQNQIAPITQLEGKAIHTLRDKEIGVIVHAISAKTVIDNTHIYQYKDNVYYVSTDPMAKDSVINIGTGLLHGVTFYQRGQVYKPMGEDVTFNKNIKCIYNGTSVVYGTLDVSATLTESSDKYTLNVDGPEGKVLGKGKITNYVLVSNGETILSLYSKPNLTYQIPKSELGVTQGLEIHAYSKNNLVGIGTVQYQ